ncbi:hypothetical protein AMECASPLE_013214 [Ameca splendens]|uniref:Uncharacterized protein n=1 Tax=Ameca splendens TaxID=208324 RepID=A0ABV0Y1N6_9TELE
MSSTGSDSVTGRAGFPPSLPFQSAACPGLFMEKLFSFLVNVRKCRDLITVPVSLRCFCQNCQTFMLILFQTLTFHKLQANKEEHQTRTDCTSSVVSLYLPPSIHHSVMLEQFLTLYPPPHIPP